MVTPASRVIGRNLRLVGFHYHTGCVIMGVQRRSRMMRGRMENIRLEASDVLLVLGLRERVEDLRFSREVSLIEWSVLELPARHHAKRALGIFAAVAATGFVPIAVAALAGALGMITLGCLNVPQAAAPLTARWPFWWPPPWPWAAPYRPRAALPIWHSAWSMSWTGPARPSCCPPCSPWWR
ncbi:MAG: TrkA C-terminal domain-containing protein [Alphaproteobacteria bacterium]